MKQVLMMIVGLAILMIVVQHIEENSPPHNHFAPAIRKHLHKLCEAPRVTGSSHALKSLHYIHKQLSTILSSPSSPSSSSITAAVDSTTTVKDEWPGAFVIEQHQQSSLNSSIRSGGVESHVGFENLTNVVFFLPSLSPQQSQQSDGHSTTRSCVVIDAHYDSGVGSRGASDYGYGVASMLGWCYLVVYSV